MQLMCKMCIRDSLHTEDERRHAVLDLCGRVGWRLRRSGVVGYTVTLKVKFASFKIITRSITAEGPVDVYKRQ